MGLSSLWETQPLGRPELEPPYAREPPVGLIVFDQFGAFKIGGG